MPRRNSRDGSGPPAWRWLDPPVANGTSTIHEVSDAADIDAYVRGIWQAWAPHRAQVEAWAATAVSREPGIGRCITAS